MPTNGYTPLALLPKGYVPPLKVVKLYARQHGKCPYTGLPLYPFVEQNMVSIDHIIPRAKGGTDRDENLCLVPMWVNTFKADMSVADFKIWLKENGFPVKTTLADWFAEALK